MLRTILISSVLLTVIQAQLLIPKIRPAKKIIPGIKTQIETTESAELRQVTRPIPKKVEETSEAPAKRRPQESTVQPNSLEETTEHVEQLTAAAMQESATHGRGRRAAKQQEDTTGASGKRRPQETTAGRRNQEETTGPIEQSTEAVKRGTATLEKGTATGMRGSRSAKVPPPSTVAPGGRGRRSAN